MQHKNKTRRSSRNFQIDGNVKLKVEMAKRFLRNIRRREK